MEESANTSAEAPAQQEEQKPEQPQAFTSNPFEAAWKRMGVIMAEMIKASNAKDKARLVHMSESLMEQCDDVVGYIYEESGVTEKDIHQFGSSEVTDSNLLKLASKPEGEPYMTRRAEIDTRRG